MAAAFGQIAAKFIERSACEWVLAIMKFLSIGILVSLTIGCSASQDDTVADLTNADSPATGQVGRLSLQGEKILGPDGVEIKLRGWNWGQWNTVLAGDLASQGYPNANPSDPSDGRDAVNQGANVVRILLRWWGQYGDNLDRFGLPVDSRDEHGVAHVSAQALALLDDEITEATRHGLWVVLAVDSNCGQQSPTDDDPSITYCNDAARGIDHANFVNDPAMKAEFMEIWAHLADTYKGHGHIAMYEVLPEPQFGCAGVPKNCNYDEVTAFYTDLITTIRSKDAVTPILVGPGSGYSMKHIDTAFIPDPDGTKKLIYTADMLSEEAIHRTDLPTFTSFRSAHDVPVLVQQVGINQSNVAGAGDVDSATYLADVRSVLQQLDDDDIGWTWWTYREQNSGGTGFAPLYLSQAPDTWAAAAPPNMLGTISSYFTR